MSKRILLVEDNDDNRAIYRTILEHMGYEVLEAVDGEEGIRLGREERPDLILMDISIPIVDGWDAITTLKGEEGTRAIPIVALTAHALPADRTKAMEVGSDGYLAKPVSPRDVADEVARLIGPATDDPGGAAPAG